MLLCAVGLSQIAELIFFESSASLYFYLPDNPNSTGHVTAILVGLAVAWYALSLRDRALGGALVLGWATVTLIFFLVDFTYAWRLPYISDAPRIWGFLGCALLAIVVILTVAYTRGQPDPEPSRPEKSRELSP